MRHQCYFHFFLIVSSALAAIPTLYLRSKGLVLYVQHVYTLHYRYFAGSDLKVISSVTCGYTFSLRLGGPIVAFDHQML